MIVTTPNKNTAMTIDSQVIDLGMNYLPAAILKLPDSEELLTLELYLDTLIDCDDL